MFKDTNTLIGTALVYYEEEVECWEIGYNLGKKYWGKGYTTEANDMCMMIDDNKKRESVFKLFMEKMAIAEKTIEEQGYYSEKEVEEELSFI